MNQGCSPRSRQPHTTTHLHLHNDMAPRRTTPLAAGAALLGLLAGGAAGAHPTVTMSDATLVVRDFSGGGSLRSGSSPNCVRILAGSSGDSNKAKAACGSCYAQWHASMAGYETRLKSWERKEAQYQAAMRKYEADMRAYNSAVQQHDAATRANAQTTPGTFGTQYVPTVPPRPVRPVDRAGPKPQPPSQNQQTMIVESCLKGESKNFDDGSDASASSSDPMPEPAPAPACQGGCCDVAPPASTYSCEQQATWGKCDEAWLAGFCDLSCGRCAPSEAGVAANATANANATADAKEELPDATNRRMLMVGVV